MFGIPFLKKNNTETEKYIFMLFLSGEKVYGYAFEENNPDNKSSLYQEHIDAFLKDAVEKIEKIIANCEADLGQSVYIKKTVLLLNSLYTTESGSIREDFLNQIKKLLKNLDLDNLGYINFYEMILYDLAEKKEDCYLLEESIYDYTIYECKKNQVQKVNKIAKTQEEKQPIKEIKRYLVKDQPIIAFFYTLPHKEIFKNSMLIKETDFPKLFTQIYYKEKGVNSVTTKTSNNELTTAGIEESITENQKSKDEPDDFSGLEGLPEAPGFSNQEENYESEPKPITKQSGFEPKTKSFNFPKIALFSNFSLPKLDWLSKLFKTKAPILIIGAVLLILLTIPLYFFVFHKANIYLTTKKENFSSKLKFIISDKSGFVKEHTQTINIETSQTTTGEKVTGEKSNGSVTIYNGLFEEQSLESGTQIQTGDGVTFLLDNAVTVPSATKSANLDEGVETTAFGKKNTDATAVNIGADANINDGTKLFFAEYDNDKLYALANKEFTGGFKKTTRVFAEKDKKNLEKKAMALIKKDIIKEFSTPSFDKDQLYIDTLTLDNAKKTYSAEIDDEVDTASIKINGKTKVFYSPYDDLVKKVQSEKLKDKEFVDGTLQLTKISLVNENEGIYTYSVLAKGQVQNLIDKNQLLNKLKGKTVSGAEKILRREENIIDFNIKTLPVPLPLIPINTESIKFKFNY